MTYPVSAQSREHRPAGAPRALIISGADHMANTEAPEQVNAAMLRCLADQQH